MLRTQAEVVRRVNAYKKQLAAAVEEKTLFENKFSPNIDLIIFALVDKLEALLWVLEVELPADDLLDQFASVIH